MEFVNVPLMKLKSGSYLFLITKERTPAELVRQIIVITYNSMKKHLMVHYYHYHELRGCRRERKVNRH